KQQPSTAKQQAEWQSRLQHPALLPGRMSSVQKDSNFVGSEVQYVHPFLP
ncbi:hypothetical protein NDU88_005500, partial [Pleurodeles waltl]